MHGESVWVKDRDCLDKLGKGRQKGELEENRVVHRTAGSSYDE